MFGKSVNNISLFIIRERHKVPLITKQHIHVQIPPIFGIVTVQGNNSRIAYCKGGNFNIHI